MRINSIKIKGFKNFKEEKSFTLSEFSQIIADNGKGKTSVGDAIAWLIYGCNLFGNDKSDSSLLNNQSKEMSGTMNFDDNSGVNHTLTRCKKKSTELILDNRKITQSELSAILTFPKDIFLSIFNPEYFMNMSSLDGRKFLSRILPTISKDEVFIEMEKSDQYLLGLIKDDDFISGNVYLSKLRDELAEAEGSITFTEGSISAKENDLRNLVIPEILTFNKEESLLALKNQYNALLNGKPEVTDVSELKLEVSDLEKQLISIDTAKVELEDITQIEKKVTELQTKHEILETQMNKTFKPGDICPTCGQIINQDHIEMITSEIKNKISDIDDELNSLKSEIDTLNELNQLKIEDFNSEIEQQKNAITEQINNLNNCIKDISAENEKALAGFEDSISDKKQDLQSKIDLLEAEKVSAMKSKVQYNMSFENKKVIKQEIEKYQLQLQNMLKLKDSLKLKIQAIEKFNNKVIEIQNDIMKPYLDKVSIKLQKLIKSSGEVKDCFEILYDGKDYKVLSRSEKIKAGLELSRLIMQFTDIKVPIFVDNAESIVEYFKPQTQIIEARVIEGCSIEVVA